MFLPNDLAHINEFVYIWTRWVLDEWWQFKGRNFRLICTEISFILCTWGVRCRYVSICLCLATCHYRGQHIRYILAYAITTASQLTTRTYTFTLLIKKHLWPGYHKFSKALWIIIYSIVILLAINVLTRWGRVVYMCVSILPVISSDNGLTSGRRQAIIWTNAWMLLIGPFGTNFSEVAIEI